MRVAVTGAAGFIGHALTMRLVADGHEVIAVGRRPFLVQGFATATWDLSTDERPPEALSTIDAVVHTAAHVRPWGSSEPFDAVTVRGTERLINIVPAQARLVVIGSASVYDPRVDHVLARENEAPVAPSRYLNEYGRAKAAQERLVLERRPDAIVLRPRAAWGPGDTTLLPRLVAGLRGDRLFLPNGGRRLISTTHISTIVAAIVAALGRPGVRGPVNVADATPRTAAQLVPRLMDVIGRHVRIVAVPGAIADMVARVEEGWWRLSSRRGEPPVTRYAVAAFAHDFTLDLTRLHEELGIRPDVDVESAIGEMRSLIEASS